MGMLVHHADKIRHATGAHVNFVHHSGKDRARGARGHSSLRAAVDTEIEVHRTEGADYSTVKIVKQREMEIGPAAAFKLEPIILGLNRYAEEVSSCVVRDVSEEDLSAPQQDKTLTAMQQFVYDAILNAAIRGGKRVTPRDGAGDQNCITYDAMRRELEIRGFKDMVDADKAKNVTTNTRIALRRSGKVDFTSTWIWVITDG
jgi:hypothetical protein